MDNIKILYAKSEMTGGNIWTYWGRLEDGRYYAFTDTTFGFYDADYGYTMTEEFFNETEGDSWEWEQEHCKGTYEESYGQWTDEIREIVETTIKECERK